MCSSLPPHSSRSPHSQGVFFPLAFGYRNSPHLCFSGPPVASRLVKAMNHATAESMFPLRDAKDGGPKRPSGRPAARGLARLCWPGHRWDVRYADFLCPSATVLQCLRTASGGR